MLPTSYYSKLKHAVLVKHNSQNLLCICGKGAELGSFFEDFVLQLVGHLELRRYQLFIKKSNQIIRFQTNKNPFFQKKQGTNGLCSHK